MIAGGPNRRLNAAAFMIHSAIHAARPEVMCAAHSHSIYGRAFCALGRELDVISQDACAFYNVLLPSPILLVMRERKRERERGCADADGRTTSYTNNSTALSSPKKKATTSPPRSAPKKPPSCKTTACSPSAAQSKKPFSGSSVWKSAAMCS